MRLKRNSLAFVALIPFIADPVVRPINSINPPGSLPAPLLYKSTFLWNIEFCFHGVMKIILMKYARAITITKGISLQEPCRGQSKTKENSYSRSLFESSAGNNVSDLLTWVLNDRLWKVHDYVSDTVNDALKIPWLGFSHFIRCKTWIFPLDFLPTFLFFNLFTFLSGPGRRRGPTMAKDREI